MAGIGEEIDYLKRQLREANERAERAEQAKEWAEQAKEWAEQAKERAEQAQQVQSERVERAEQAKELAERAKQVQAERVERAQQQAERAERAQQVQAEKISGEYWHCFKDVWRFEPAPFANCFQQGRDLRQHARVDVYAATVDAMHDFLTFGEGVEAVLPSVFSGDSERVDTVDSSELARRGEWNRLERQSHHRKHLKNFLGQSAARSDCFRAHAFPNAQDCNKWWWPMFQLVTGDQNLEFSQLVLDKVTSMRTNKICFPVAHKHIYDTLKHGIVCAIPIYASMEEMAQWQYQNGFKMLIVCDSPSTYCRLRMLDEESHSHVQIATEDDIRNATQLVGEMMKILADSLITNWEDHYQSFEDCSRKEMLSLMRTMLMDNNTIDIPVYNLADEAPKLYTIDYSVLYENDEEGAKYIHDPFLALIKAGMNLSAFVSKQHEDNWKKACKLLPVDDDESVWSFDILELFDRRTETHGSEKTSVGLIGREIQVHDVPDDDEEEEGKEEQKEDTDGSASVSSDLTA